MTSELPISVFLLFSLLSLRKHRYGYCERYLLKVIVIMPTTTAIVGLELGFLLRVISGVLN